MQRTLSKDRVAAGIGAVLLEGLILYALLSGLMVGSRQQHSEALRLFEVTVPPEAVPPPSPPQPAPPRTKAPEGAASPANIRSRATPVVAPEPVIVLPPVQPVIAAPEPATGSDPTSGNTDVPGPGTGSGGIGNGTGSGRGGYGSGGGGGGGGAGTPPRRTGGRLRDSDYPRWAWEAGVGGRVSVIFSIETNGRVGECDTTRSSGSADLDAMTCRLIRERYRFRPALDRQGRPVRSRMTENHDWVVEIEPPER